MARSDQCCGAENFLWAPAPASAPSFLSHTVLLGNLKITFSVLSTFFCGLMQPCTFFYIISSIFKSLIMEPERNFGSESGSATLVQIQLLSEELGIRVLFVLSGQEICKQIKNKEKSPF